MGIRMLVTTMSVVAAAIVLPPIAARANILPAAEVNVDFNTSNANSTYSGQGAAPVPTGMIAANVKWNGVVLGATVNNPSINNSGIHDFGPTSAGSLIDSNNAATSIAGSLTIELDDIRQYDTGDTGGAADLFRDYSYRPAFPVSPPAISTLKIGGVPGGLYDLYLYSENGNYASAVSTFTLGADPETATNSGISTSTFTVNRNYVLFSNVSPTSNVFSVTITGADGALNGFSLVQLPEPTSLALMGFAVLPLLRRRRAT